MSSILVISITIFLFIVELVYFKIADHFNIIDKPNHRSSHSAVTIRGGGVIFAISLLLYPFCFGLEYIWFFLGLAAISFISFMDDIKPVSNRIRVFFHLLGVAFMFYQLGLFGLPVYWIILALILVIGSINAINFMDGINGITGAYALITLCSLFWINNYVIEFTVPGMLITSIISILVFNFFNFRKNAKCFAGDVGSVSIAFIIMFLLLQLIIKTENFNYLLLLLVYGLDTVTTIFFRLIRKENIFDAHRSHFYQYCVNERKIPHLVISSIYALIQLGVNVLIIELLPSFVSSLCVVLALSTGIFVIMRIRIEGKVRLFGR